jgi:hypothetical protein
MNRFHEIEAELRRQFEAEGASLNIMVGMSSLDSETWWNTQIVDVAHKHGYWADLSKFRRWAQVRLRLTGIENTQSNIVVSFHHRDRTPGLMVANAFLTTSATDSSQETWETVSLAEHPYPYSASHRDPESGFREWLDNIIEAGLDQWQTRI